MLQLLRPYSPVLRIRRSLVRAQVGEPIYSPIAQSVERRTVNPQVPGSSPGGRAKILKKPTHCEVGYFILPLVRSECNWRQSIIVVIGVLAPLSLDRVFF